jgi:hypothetical protein
MRGSILSCPSRGSLLVSLPCRLLYFEPPSEREVANNVSRKEPAQLTHRARHKPSAFLLCTRAPPYTALRCFPSSRRRAFGCLFTGLFRRESGFYLYLTKFAKGYALQKEKHRFICGCFASVTSSGSCYSPPSPQGEGFRLVCLRFFALVLHCERLLLFNISFETAKRSYFKPSP